MYAGVDPSAASLHLGNLLPLMVLLHLQLAGNMVLALVSIAADFPAQALTRQRPRSVEQQARSVIRLDGRRRGTLWTRTSWTVTL